MSRRSSEDGRRTIFVAPPQRWATLAMRSYPGNASGYATQALREVLLDARAEGLRYVEITTRPANLASQRVITANGGVLIEEFVTPESVGGHIEMRYRVHLR